MPPGSAPAMVSVPPGPWRPTAAAALALAALLLSLRIKTGKNGVKKGRD